VALLILSRFSPSEFDASELSSCTGHLGYICIDPLGPFSQIAQLDGSLKPLSIMVPARRWESLGRYIHQVNVQRCIDLALGIFRFECLGRPRTVVLPKDQIDPRSSLNWAQVLEECFTNPWSKRLLAVRKNLTHLTGGEVSQDYLYGLTSTSHFDFRELCFKEGYWKTPFGLFSASPFEESMDIMHTVMAIAVVIAGLQPWGLPLVIPRSLVDVLCPVLELSFPNDSTDPPMLVRKVSQIPRTMVLDIPSWTWGSLDEAMEGLQAIRLQHFPGLSSRFSLYYDTMVFLFKLNSIEMQSVNVSLAAWCPVHYLESRAAKPPEDLDAWKRQCRAALRERLNGQPMDEVPEWALEVLATVLRGWLMDPHPIKEDFRTIFRRRVFLE
jgi:hypothetical protein